MRFVRAGRVRPDVSPELFAALRCCGLDQPFQAKVSDYEHFFRCCHRHGITARLFENLQKHGTQDQQLFERARQDYQAQFFTYAGYRDFLDRLHHLLNSTKLQVALLKGASLWFTCYENPVLRHISDVDLLIPSQDLHRLEAVLATLGYVADRERKLFRDGSGRIIDVHSGNLGLAEESSGISSEKLLASARPLASYPAFLTADPLLETRYLAFHAMKHSFLRFNWLHDVYLSHQRHPEKIPSKPVEWALYLHQLLESGASRPNAKLNGLERYLARRMLRVDQHPLGQVLLACYQPTWKDRFRCLVQGTRGRTNARESLPRRIYRLVQEATGIFA